MLKDWTQTICAVVTLAILCGSMLVYAVLSIYGQNQALADSQRAALNSLAQQFQTAHMDMMERVTKVEEHQKFDDTQINQTSAAMDRLSSQTNNSIDKLNGALQELTKELSNLEGVIADGHGQK